MQDILRTVLDEEEERKMNKKLVSMALAAVLALGSAGAAMADADGLTINFWHTRG